MNNNIKILYDGKDVFSGIAPTPIVGISNEVIDFGSKWNQVTNITLEGQITGKFLGGLSYKLLNENVAALHSGFRNNYKTLLIQENGVDLYTGLNTVINSINIEESPWYGILPFTIEMSIYDSGLFQDYYHIVEPEETFAFEESEDKNDLILNRTLSAKGLVSNGQNAIKNAKDWVLSKTGDISKVTPILSSKASSFTGRNFLLQSSKEVVDRFNGVYTWEGSYKKSINSENPDNCFLNYTVDLSSGIDDGFINASIKGSLEGNDISILRSGYNELDLYSLCNSASLDTFNKTLSNRILTQSLDETVEERRLEFSASFNDDYTDEIINNYSVDINEDSLKCIRTVNFSTNISCRYGDLDTRWQKVYSFYKNRFSPYSLARAEFSKDFPGVLYDTPISESINFNEFNAQINYSAQYTDKRVSLNQDVINITSSANLTPSIKVHVANASAFVPRDHNIFNLQAANRTVLEISVTVVVKMNKNILIAENEATNEALRIKNNYINGANNPLLEKRTVSRNNDIKTVTINETWSFEGQVITS